MDKDEWSKVKEFVKINIGESAHTNWIQPIELKEIKGTVAKFKVPTRFIGTWVHRNYGDHIIQGFKNQKININRLEFISSSDKRSNKENGSEKSTLKMNQKHQESQLDLPSSPLDARFTFDKFVVGRPNELAHAAAKRVSDGGKVTFNPLFLYGGVGLGKTHLMHSIAWSIKEKNKKARILYLSAEQFMYRFVQALRFKDMHAFKKLFRSVDVLMVDDVQFIAGKDSTQDEFFHTFNALIEQGKQIVISADRAPGEIDGLEERIKSRLAWGLVVDVHPTDYELRLGILQAKAEVQMELNRDVKIDEGILEYLAHKISSNVRVLEGALTRLFAFASLVGKEINIDLAQECLSDILRTSERKVTIEEIIRKVAEHYNLRMTDLISARRARVVARPRQIAMFLSKSLTSKSLPEIGRKFGGRDHTTVIHAVKKIEELKLIDVQVADEVEILRRTLEA
jgi:chromosomal replication initiator protein